MHFFKLLFENDEVEVELNYWAVGSSSEQDSGHLTLFSFRSRLQLVTRARRTANDFILCLYLAWR